MKAWLLGMLCATLTSALAISQSPASLAIAPLKLIFPDTKVGAPTSPLAITVTNTTSSAVQLQEIIVSGIDFAQTNDCGSELAAGAKCSIQVVFKPAISGERLGSLEIVASNKQQPDFVALTGTGTD